MHKQLTFEQRHYIKKWSEMKEAAVQAPK